MDYSVVGSAASFSDDALTRVKVLIGDRSRGADTSQLRSKIPTRNVSTNWSGKTIWVEEILKDHCQTYKRKENRFIGCFTSEEGSPSKLLVYMHRMNAFTVRERPKSNYLMPFLKQLMRSSQIDRLESRAEGTLAFSELPPKEPNRRIEATTLLLKDSADKPNTLTWTMATKNYELFWGGCGKVKWYN